MRIAAYVLLTCVAVLLALGMVMLYSASMTQKGEYYLGLQLSWCVLGVVAGFLAGCLDYRVWKKVAIPLAVGSSLLLLLVFVPGIGLKINGARRWLDLGPMRFQPSELAKFAVVVGLAFYAEHNRRSMHRFVPGVVIPGAALIVILGLILAGKDYGTTMLVGAVAAMLLMVAGVQWKAFVPVLAVVAVVLGLLIWNNPVRRERVLAWLYPEMYKETTGYQAWQAQIALGSGGLNGLGLGNGRQKLGFMPEHRTDFLFPIIGEELGLLATVPVVMAYIIIIICGVFIAGRAPDPFGMYLAMGITFLIGLQAFINIGVVTSLLPNKGLPLPFISYGGSNLLIMLTSVGILWSVARQGRVPQAAPDDPFALENMGEVRG